MGISKIVKCPICSYVCIQVFEEDYIDTLVCTSCTGKYTAWIEINVKTSVSQNNETEGRDS